MTCGEFSERASDYIEREVAGDDRATMDRHIADCPSCAEIVKNMQPLMDRLARLSWVRPSVGFDFALRSRLLMEVAEAKQWRRRLQAFLFPSVPRVLVSGVAVALLALGVTTVLNEKPSEKSVAWEVPGSGGVQRPAGTLPAYPTMNGRGALKQVSQGASYPISRSALQFYTSQSDSMRPATRTPARQRRRPSGVQRVSVRF
jgi:predicted anti-sigma-YlaC factor YlaD